jgi:colanic acid biosynthesis protein WcaH
MQQTLTPEEFLAVVDKTPLVSMDLVVRDQQRRVLLGIRVNEPARGFWFVPGGRIMKGETLDEAFTHQYDTNFAGIPEIGTHYVVLAYELELELALDFDQIPQLEHSNYRWWTSSEATSSEDVHPNNLPYFLLAEGA